ncbi:MAG: tetratricopeptide repeat protein, partial [Anaerolineales bacterium]|nr:tetratricopeptide repeat protein [Anaerolineales bacterium]
RPAEIGALAHHFWEAQKWDKAAYYHQLAGERAGEVYANAEAMNHFCRALEAIHRLPGSPDLRQIYAIRLACEKIYDLQGEREDQTLELDALAGLAENLDDDRYRAEVALRRARQADLTCDFLKSITAASQAVKLARAAKDPTIEIESYMEWGWCLLLQGEHDAARSQFEQALPLARSNGLKRLEADALHGVGTVGLVTGNYLEAKNYFHQVLDICRQVDIRPREGSTFANLGYIAAAQGDHTASQFYNEQALRLHRETGDQRGAALVMQASSEFYLSEGKFSTAQDYMEQALTIQEAIQARDNIGVTLRSLGILYHHLGDYARAKEYYERAQAIFLEIGIPFYQGQTLAYLSLLSHHLGNDQAACEQSQQGLEIARKIDDRLGQGLLLDSLGHALTGLGRLEQAVEAYRTALALHQELNEPHMAAESRAGLARLALLQGNLAAAAEQVEEILRIQKGGGIGSVNEPFRVYLTCYQVLNTRRDPRAAGVLRTAYELLMTQKANIKDAKVEHSFLEVVAAHREIVAAYTQNQGEKVIIQLPKKGALTGRALHADECVDALWTPFAPEDERIPDKVARRRHRLSRLLKEAKEQGGVPTYQHLAEALSVGLRTIERDMMELKKEGITQ